MTQIFETITIEADERGVATLRLNRPEKHNALNYLMIHELRKATAQLAVTRAQNAIKTVFSRRGNLRVSQRLVSAASTAPGTDAPSRVQCYQ